ncbi:TerB family tellurite resistance protein [Pseudoalteromonas viridis]|uniref:tellurite resistance TerB family protein n=1 Tax=Pseudoalteromonas viridis TaxID=339617 RepID=UPI001FFE26EC|nr:TerB family tellurite resistance protein [Pseudoalteromonas viridis]
MHLFAQLRKFINTLAEQPESDQAPDFTTALAALMVEIMRADGEVHVDECHMIARLLTQHSGISTQASELIRDQAIEMVDEAIDLHRFIRVVNAHTGELERIEVIELLWLVAYADGRLDPHEEHMVRKIAGLLYVAHADFISAKLTARQQLKLTD